MFVAVQTSPAGFCDHATAARIAGIDVHKKILAVVVADVEVDGDFHFERQTVGTTVLISSATASA